MIKILGMLKTPSHQTPKTEFPLTLSRECQSWTFFKGLRFSLVREGTLIGRLPFLVLLYPVLLLAGEDLP